MHSVNLALFLREKLETKEYDNALDSLCTAAPHLKKIGKELLSDFFEVRGGCTQATLWTVRGVNFSRICATGLSEPLPHYV